MVYPPRQDFRSLPARSDSSTRCQDPRFSKAAASRRHDRARSTLEVMMFGRLDDLSCRNTFCPRSTSGLTQFAGRRCAGAAGIRATTRLIRWFVGKYGVDMSEAENPDIASGASFNDFFGRPPKPGGRNRWPMPISSLRWTVPSASSARSTTIISCRRRGHRFTTTQLLRNRDDAALADRFRHGSFATLRSRRRIITGCTCRARGRLQRMIYVPGALFSVNPTTARGVPRPVRPQRTRGLRIRLRNAWALRDGAGRRDDRRQHGDHLARRGQSAAHRGDRRMGVRRPPDRCSSRARMGRFLRGSTVIMLFEKDIIDFNAAHWRPEGRRFASRFGRGGGRHALAR